MINIQERIGHLVGFGLKAGLIEEADTRYVVNQIIDILGLSEFSGVIDRQVDQATPVAILNDILDWAYEAGLMEGNSALHRDLLDTRIMDVMIPRPSTVICAFKGKYKQGPDQATDWYYQLAQDANYIRTDRIAKNQKWQTETPFGTLDITINLSKPEKDPKDIAAALKQPSSAYPKCLLCAENEGYSGRLNHPARQNHRIIPLTLKGEPWFLQYSPYVYYNEHAIILKGAHDPMKIGRDTFERLLDFVTYLPHYFVGSNADLPIVGGSILSHDHFQGGRYTFAMEKAPIALDVNLAGHDQVEAGIVDWPMSVLRLRSKDREALVQAADTVLANWRQYSDPGLNIEAFTGDTPHNTITPIARMRDGVMELDLVLRNNRTSETYPAGIFHPHDEVHHIKKENIGLIEVMGLAVLPARLASELDDLASWMTGQGAWSEDLDKHKTWAQDLIKNQTLTSKADALALLRKGVGQRFEQVLSHAGVYKTDPVGRAGFKAFVDSIQ